LRCAVGSSVFRDSVTGILAAAADIDELVTMSVLGSLRFLAPESRKPVFDPSTGGAAAHSTLIGDYEDRSVEVLDGRSLEEAFDLDAHGFELRRLAPVGDLYDREVVATSHDAQCRALVTEATGASRVEIFDHTWRSSAADVREQHASREPSAFIHNDYTPRSAVKRVNELMGDEADALARQDFVIVNVWRPIAAVHSSPLAICDAQSLSPDSLVAAERRGKGRIGEIYLVRYAAGQRWIYFPEMAVDEVLLIKTYDSRTDGRARWCAHTSFELSGRGPGVAPRESMETRLFAFFG
jgi:hypothetical protein